MISFLTIENKNLNIDSDPWIKSDRDSIRNSCDVLFCCLAVSVIDRLFLHFFGCCFSIFLCICVCLLVFLSMFFHLFELPFLWEEEAFILLFLGAELELPGSYKQVGTLQTLCKKQNSCFRLRTAGNTSIPFTTVRKKAGRIRFLYIYSTFTFWKKSSCFLPDICIKPVCQYFRQSSRENRNFCSCTKFRFRSTPNLGTWKRKCEKLSCQI